MITLPPSPTLVPVAEYVRMSDEIQRYSIDNQKAANREFAVRHGFVVVKTYADAGRSGVTTKNRSALRELLKDVVSGEANYKAILIYDVSRWGRFQDVDEAAHYEYICKSSGIPVHYCAEQFANDGTAASSILKALKRSIAAEFSRELGEKVFRGKVRLVRLGFWVGGRAGFGFRRLMISADGTPKQLLETGEHKSLTTDRVILVPGPREEIRCVRHMFSMAAAGNGISAIARDLNKRRTARNSRVWSPVTVENVLNNPKYAGWNIWNRTDQRLSMRRKQIKPQDWITQPRAFIPIVQQEIYDRSQAARPKWVDIVWSDAAILKKLRRLLAAKGRLSCGVMSQAKGMPSWSTIKHHFGSVRKAWQSVGYDAGEVDIITSEKFEPNKRWRRTWVAQLKKKFPNHIAVTHLPCSTRSILRIDDTFLVSILICQGRKPRKKLLWEVKPITRERELITLLCRVSPDYARVAPFYIFSNMNQFITHDTYHNDPWLRNGVKLHSMSEFYETVVRVWKSQTRSHDETT